jgi:hypothetical protein
MVGERKNRQPGCMARQYHPLGFDTACNLARAGYKWSKYRPAMSPSSRMRNFSIDGCSHSGEVLTLKP